MLSPRIYAESPRYTGSKVCAGCHSAIYRSYAKTAMGNSMSIATPEGPDPSVRIHSEVLNRDFTLSSDKSTLYQTESQHEGDRTVFENTQKLVYAIGSGENGKSFIVQRGGYLFQAPLSYYSRTGKWDLSPGFENSDQGFNRPIYDACITCHAGRAQPVPRRDGLYLNPPFQELAIGCENCHGPGQLHVDQKSRKLRSPPGGSIVNPARLSARVAEDICIKCHQGGDTRALLPGKEYSDFLPGTALLETVAIVSLPPKDSQSDLLEHELSMKLSKCYRASNGRLSCLTCHDPHQQPAADEAPGYFRQRCLTCHAAKDCKQSLPVRLAQQPPDNCIGCHMPKRDIQRISHSALTNHRIPVRADEALPAVPAELSSPQLPGLLLLDATQGSPPLPEITRLSIYGELLNRDPQFQTPYFAILENLSHSMPDDPLVLAALGRKALLEKNDHAIDYLSRAVRSGTPAKATFIDLAEALTQAGRGAEAIPVLEQANDLYPYSPEIRKHLLLSYIQNKRYDRAGPSLERYVQDFPEDSFMRDQFNRVRKR